MLDALRPAMYGKTAEPIAEEESGAPFAFSELYASPRRGTGVAIIAAFGVPLPLSLLAASSCLDVCRFSFNSTL